MRTSPVTISASDHRVLVAIVNSARLDRRVPSENLDVLERELIRARVVNDEDLPNDVVAMNTTVWFRELDSEEVEKYTLVYPGQADVVHDRISVLAPIGTALLGYRVGDVVEWRVPSGKRRFQIVDVIHDTGQRRRDEAGVLV